MNEIDLLNKIRETDVSEAEKIMFALANENQDFFIEYIDPSKKEEYKKRGQEAVDALKRIFPEGTWTAVIRNDTGDDEILAESKEEKK